MCLCVCVCGKGGGKEGAQKQLFIIKKKKFQPFSPQKMILECKKIKQNMLIFKLKLCRIFKFLRIYENLGLNTPCWDHYSLAHGTKRKARMRRRVCVKPGVTNLSTCMLMPFLSRPWGQPQIYWLKNGEDVGCFFFFFFLPMRATAHNRKIWGR